MFEIRVFENDESIAAAEFHRRWLEVLSRARRDAPAGRNAAGQCYAFDTGIVDEFIGLIVRNQKIGIQADRRARVRPKLLEGDRALRHAACMFYQQDVAGHKMRTRDPRELIIGKVPRLDAEDHADGAALHMAVTERRM